MKGEIRVLIGTDVASRGLHIEDVDCVILYDIPQNPEDYVHRIGRTARAGKSGLAISLSSEDDAYYLEPIEHLIGRKIPFLVAEESLLGEEVEREPQRERERNRDRKRRDGNGGRKAGTSVVIYGSFESKFRLALSSHTS